MSAKTDKSEFVVVLVTAPEGEPAVRLSRALVGEGLAACVNRVPGVRSVYRWQGAVHDDTETLLVIKSTRDAWPALERRIRELHPYEVPEVIALPVWAGSEPYLQWLAGSIGASPTSAPPPPASQNEP